MNSGPILVPALRGHIGCWSFYSALITWETAVNYIKTADEIVKNKQLSEMIQRQIKSAREEEVSNYILTQDERFFGSLVAAVYKGDPKWHQLGGFQEELYKLGAPAAENSNEAFGYLELTGKERIFALDGQHRLVGMRKALTEKPGLSEENITVIFVGHEDSASGLKTTRRLFTTLNKKAVPVKKGEIIALDEDDVAAILTRRMVETLDEYSGERIAYVETNRMPSGNNSSFTTIAALYDVVSLIIKDINKNISYGLPYKKDEVSLNRPSDDDLDRYFKLVKRYFKGIKKYFPEFNSYCESGNYKKLGEKLRHGTGGHILFRPQGLLIISRVIAKLTEKYSLDKSIKLISKAPLLYEDEAYSMLLWNNTSNTVVKSKEALVKDIMLYNLGAFPVGKKLDLFKRYKKTSNGVGEIPNII